MKKILIFMLSALFCIALVSCKTESLNGTVSDDESVSKDKIEISKPQPLGGNSAAVIKKYTFEEACRRANTAVVASYIKTEQFDEEYMRHEFQVKEHIFGNTEKTIGVFTLYRSIPSTDTYITSVQTRTQNHISFENGTDYLLLLYKDDSPYNVTTVYSLINDIVINLDDPSLSTMYNTSLNYHTKEIKFKKSTSKASIINYVAELVKGNKQASEYIRSENREEIITLSENIFKVRIDEIFHVTNNNFKHQEMYYCTVTEVLKGDITASSRYVIIFFPETVKEGEEYVIAVGALGDSRILKLSSKNSLFLLEEEKEISEIIKKTEA